MNKRFAGVILIFIFLLVIPLQGYAATPMETVETGINKVLKTLSDPAFKAKSKDQQIATLGSEIEKVFDFKELSRRTLGRNWKKFSAEQQTEFVKLFK